MTRYRFIIVFYIGILYNFKNVLTDDLNLQDIYNCSFPVRRSTKNGAFHTEISPINNKKILSVSYGSSVVWKAKDGETSPGVTIVNFRHTIESLLLIEVLGEGRYYVKYYTKLGDEFNEVTSAEYVEKLRVNSSLRGAKGSLLGRIDEEIAKKAKVTEEYKPTDKESEEKTEFEKVLAQYEKLYPLFDRDPESIPEKKERSSTESSDSSIGSSFEVISPGASIASGTSEPSLSKIRPTRVSISESSEDNYDKSLPDFGSEPKSFSASTDTIYEKRLPYFGSVDYEYPPGSPKSSSDSISFDLIPETDTSHVSFDKTPPSYTSGPKSTETVYEKKLPEFDNKQVFSSEGFKSLRQPSFDVIGRGAKSVSQKSKTNSEPASIQQPSKTSSKASTFSIKQKNESSIPSGESTPMSSYVEFDPKFQGELTSMEASSTTSSAIGLSKNRTIDITDPYRNKRVDVERDMNDGVPTLLMTVKKGKKVTRVVEKDNIIWEGDEESRLTVLGAYSFYGEYRLADLFFTKNDDNIVRYYKKDGNKWVQVSSEGFQESFDKLKSNIVIIDQISINVSDVGRESKFYSRYDKKGAFAQFSYYPLTGYHLTQVFDNNEKIWSSNTKRCLAVYVVKFCDQIKMLKLEISDKDEQTKEIFLRKVGKKYHKITEAQYEQLLSNASDSDDSDEFLCVKSPTSSDPKELKVQKPENPKGLPYNGKQPRELNLSGLTEAIVTEGYHEKVQYRTFLPYEGTCFSSLKYGDSVIWESLDGTCTDFVRVFLPDNEPKLGFLKIIDDGDEDDKYFVDFEKGLYGFVSPDYFMKVFKSYSESQPTPKLYRR